MILKQIVLRNFRNVSRAVFDLHPALTAVFGRNARGKTNLLEAVFFVMNGAGFRESKEIELIKKEESTGQVEASILSGKTTMKPSIVLQNKNNEIMKAFFLNKTRKKYVHYLGETMTTVLFSPHQIELITGAPQLRRDYFDKLLSRYDHDYKKKLVNYENALRQRNRLLALVHDPIKLKDELLFWNDYLEKQANHITDQRKQYVVFLNAHPTLDSKLFHLVYHRNEFSADRCTDYFERELHYKKTLIGPQKDDFEIRLYDKNVGIFGSRSEQRLAVLWLKMNEIFLSEERSGKKPVLLLDDVFSEFDEANKKLVLPLIQAYQTILTTADPRLLKLLPAKRGVIEL